MCDEPQVRLDEFFNHLISGRRRDAAGIIGAALSSGASSAEVIAELCWPALEQIHSLRRHDRISEIAHQYATRLLQQLIARLPLTPPQTSAETPVLIVTGMEPTEELGGQMVATLLENRGYGVYFAGGIGIGGVPQGQIVSQVAQIAARELVIFACVPQTVPTARLLISRLHEDGAWPQVQVVLGGVVFNRSESMAEVLGGDLWAADPMGVARMIESYPERRVSTHHRSAGDVERAIHPPQPQRPAAPPTEPQREHGHGTG